MRGRGEDHVRRFVRRDHAPAGEAGRLGAQQITRESHSFVAIIDIRTYSDERMRLTRDLLGTESSSLSGTSMMSSKEPSYMVLSSTAHCLYTLYARSVYTHNNHIMNMAIDK